MTTRIESATALRLCWIALLAIGLAGCGGGGGGGGQAAAPNFVSDVQRVVSSSADDTEPVELAADTSADSGADAEPLSL